MKVSRYQRGKVTYKIVIHVNNFYLINTQNVVTTLHGNILNETETCFKYFELFQAKLTYTFVFFCNFNSSIF